MSKTAVLFKDKAKTMGIDTSDKRKDDVIRAIQVHEGNSPCFKTGIDDCGESDCCWRKDCLQK
jgi:hypothetical protein